MDGKSIRPHASGRTKRGAATRARIVDTAADMMHDHGVAATSVDGVLAASHTSKSQLYHYFEDKNDLTLAVVDRQTERVLDAQRSLLGRVDSLSGLRRWAETIAEFRRADGGAGGCPLGSLAAELSDNSDAARLALQDSFRSWEQLIETALVAIVDSGELRADAPTADLAAMLLTAMQGGLLLTQATGDTRHLELTMRVAIDRVAEFAVTRR